MVLTQLQVKPFLSSSSELEKNGNSLVHISQLPTEIMLRLFYYLGPEDLCRCSQVCSSWSELAKTGSLWRHLYPVRWARGKPLIACGSLTDRNIVYLALFKFRLWWCNANKHFLLIVGDYYSGPPGDLDQEPDEDWVRSRQNEGRAYQEWDEDADVDESGED